jgi:hypothetical protein
MTRFFFCHRLHGARGCLINFNHLLLNGKVGSTVVEVDAGATRMMTWRAVDLEKLLVRFCFIKVQDT